MMDCGHRSANEDGCLVCTKLTQASMGILTDIAGLGRAERRNAMKVINKSRRIKQRVSEAVREAEDDIQ